MRGTAELGLSVSYGRLVFLGLDERHSRGNACGTRRKGQRIMFLIGCARPGDAATAGPNFWLLSSFCGFNEGTHRRGVLTPSAGASGTAHCVPARAHRG